MRESLLISKCNNLADAKYVTSLGKHGAMNAEISSRIIIQFHKIVK